MTLSKILAFQKKIAKNNSREWFKANESAYRESEAEFRVFVKEVTTLMQKHDVLDESETKIYRIYRDVRFANDKTPYTLHRSVSFRRATAARRGGYYLKIQPGDSFLAGGFWQPNPQDLLHIRRQLSQDPDTLMKILKSKAIKDYFGELEGERVKTTPKGFLSDDPAIEHLRHKGFILVHSFTEKEVLSADFARQVSDGFKKMRPFLDYMTEILTTDLNGESLLDS
jgi:uncharacterized protein (TIGR02453 family)